MKAMFKILGRVPRKRLISEIFNLYDKHLIGAGCLSFIDRQGDYLTDRDRAEVIQYITGSGKGKYIINFMNKTVIFEGRRASFADGCAVLRIFKDAGNIYLESGDVKLPLELIEVQTSTPEVDIF